MRQFWVGKKTIHLVWDVFPESFRGRLWGFETVVPRTPLRFVPTLLLRTNIFSVGFLLLGGREPRDLLRFRLSFRVVLS